MSVAGTWNLQIKSPMGDRPATLELSGESELSGSVKAEQGNTDVSGTLDGDAVAFKGTMSGQMGEIELTFSGKLDGDEMSGDVQFGSFGSGSWSATRS